jgi:hypothetical protein
MIKMTSLYDLMIIALQKEDDDLEQLDLIRNKMFGKIKEEIKESPEKRECTPSQVLVNVDEQMMKVKVSTDEAFGKVIIEKLHNKTDNNFDNSLFAQSFTSVQMASDMKDFACEQAATSGFTTCSFLPPLHLRSNETINYKLPCILLVCHKNGSMIPVVTNDTEFNVSVDDVLSRIYSLSSVELIDRSNFAKILSNSNSESILT